MKPLAIDLFCGLGGWAEGFLAEGYWVVGFDIERHDYGTGTYPGDFVMQDVLTIHGKQFKDATCIVASPPCQEPSYRAMPWSRAKALNAIGPPHKFIELFNACFRIQREASEAAGHHIPLIVENVVGAQRWVGRAGWHFGSYYLWGDIPALMPFARSRGAKIPSQDWNNFKANGEVSPHWRMESTKNNGGSWFAIGSPGQKVTGQNPDGRKQKGSGAAWFDNGICKSGSKSKARARASAEIAKIPFPLAQNIARTFLAVNYGEALP